MTTYKELEQELERVLDMTEEEACKAYNVDFKYEAIKLIQEEMKDFEEETEEETSEWFDHGFNSATDYYQYRA